MKKQKFWMMAVLTVFCLSAVMPAAADDKNSNIGLKLNLGLGSQDVASSLKLEKGSAVSLSLGYGVSQHVTLWLGMNGSEHQHEVFDIERKVVGVELGAQYKFRAHEKFRPYGKLGIGTFFLGSEMPGVTLNGGGITWALGAEYRLVKFFSVGAEVFWKDFDYTKQQIGEDNDFTDLPDPITGNTRGLMINFILH